MSHLKYDIAKRSCNVLYFMAKVVLKGKITKIYYKLDGICFKTPVIFQIYQIALILAGRAISAHISEITHCLIINAYLNHWWSCFPCLVIIYSNLDTCLLQAAPFCSLIGLFKTRIFQICKKNREKWFGKCHATMAREIFCNMFRFS